MENIKAENIIYKIDDKVILDNLSLDIEKGDLISIVGESGCGKSTFLKILSDLISISSGKLKYNGTSYGEIDPLEIRKNISYCVQLPFLFGKTVYDNFNFVFEVRKEKFNEKRVVELLERFSLTKDYIDKSINKLSGGEKQRIALIRNLIYKPEVLLLDEATSALDNENTRIIEEYVKELNNEGVTIIWVTHSDEQSYGMFKKRITMVKGKIDNIEILDKSEVIV
ncbi:ATP-binding cassette domain-containing protein [uncultured Clostridium sp.]|uniref:ABC transporter ATP-binding protein n=1 Tax=uncultured Clostridium sp. TaxID=59620 RepID=UPI002615216E|nr:ATP-binding cassette domain-containing protein [uncultured Clostridium sp.]